MYIAGRWVSLEMANTIFVLWAVAVAAVGLAVWSLSRRRPPAEPTKKAVTRGHRGKRHKR